MEKKPEYIEYEDGSRVALDADDAPEWTEADFAHAKKFSDLPFALQQGLQSLSKRGRPKLANPKCAIKLRIDTEVLESFKALGKGWQTRMNSVLKEWITHHQA